jgi:oxygen-dependent protoporphyrinogen oxidase
VSHGSTIVVGAGMSGLACAFDLARARREVVVLEASDRAGGVVGTIERDGFRFEIGPNTIQASAAAFRTLCGELGLADRLVGSPPDQRDRFVFVRGKLRALPSSPVAFLESSMLSLRARLHAGSEPLRKWKPPADGSELDLETLLTERLGAEAARVLGGAFVRGIFACEMSELGARSAMPKMWRALEEHGSFLSAMHAMSSKPAPDLPGPNVSRMSLMSLPDGLQEIVDALARELGPRLRTGCVVDRIERVPGRTDEGVRSRTDERVRGEVHERSVAGTGDRGWRVVTKDGQSLEAEHLVLAVPAPSAARLLESVGETTLPLETLRQITHSSVTVVHLGFAEGELDELPAGFGYLVPPPESPDSRRSHRAPGTHGTHEAGGAEDRIRTRASARGADSEEPLVLGTIFVSNLFAGRAPPGSKAVSSFYTSGDVEQMNDRELIAQGGRDLALALRRDEPPHARVEHIQRWSDVIPRYSVGHAERIEALLERVDAELPGLHLAGSYVAGISGDDVIARGRAAASVILGSARGSESGDAARGSAS